MKKLFLVMLLTLCVSTAFSGNVYALTREEVTANLSIRAEAQDEKEAIQAQILIERQERYEVAQEKYQQKAEEYRTQKAELIEARERFRKMKSEEEKERFEIQARAYLASAVETLTERARRIILWVDGHPRIDAEVQAEAIAKLQAEIDALDTMIQGVSDMEISEIKALTLEIRARVSTYNDVLRSIVQTIKEKQIEKTWKQANELLNRFLSNIEAMEDKGIDMTAARKLLISANTKLSGELTQESVVSAYADLRQLLVHLKQANQLQASQN